MIDLVIRLSEKEYDEILDAIEILEISGVGLGKLSIALKNGTPLPKGHGDLIDRKELLAHEVWGTFGETGYDAPCVFKAEIEAVQTIIEADKED